MSIEIRKASELEANRLKTTVPNIPIDQLSEEAREVFEIISSSDT